jgi:hypothetical protein
MANLSLQKFRRVDAVTQWSTQVEVTDEGFWLVPGVAALVGPMQYADAEGNAHVEYVPAETLRASAPSLVGKPVVLEHPWDGRVTSDNFKTHTIGTVLDAWFDEEEQALRVKVIINDAEAQEAIQGGKLGLSPGYLAGLAEAPEGIEADYVQTSRTYNHLAVVDEARGGDETRLHLDSKGHIDMGYKKTSVVRKDEASEAPEPEKADMGMTLDEALKKIDELQGQLDALMSAKVDMEPEEGEEAPAEGEKSDAEGEESEAEEKMEDRADAAANFARLYSQHKRALEVAAAYGLDVSDDTPTDQVRKAVVKSQLKEMRNDSAPYIEAAFDMLAQKAPRPHSVDHLSQAFRYDGAKDARYGELDLMDPLDAYRNRNRSNK